ncbi:U32 family peptidase [Thermodesulfobacteriota bacterium]
MTVSKKSDNSGKPEILAPAGNRVSFLAALAAGADAVYCGMKHFSARMAAANFSIGELASLAAMARGKGVKVYVAFNSLIKPDELNRAGRLLDQLNRQVKPEALIVQDLALVQLAGQVGYSGELHLSTLSNVSFPSALKPAHQNLGVDRIVLPRELSIDEMKTVASVCPDGLGLEVFVHGALCYAVSGRCYWSSYLGGKSGLRGRCVQPCRRIYDQGNQRERYFSCQDLSLDVLAKVLLDIPQVRAWKIEGRKKGPHYIFHTVKAYQLLRDRGSDPEMKRTALNHLSMALGRTGTHYNFLPQRPQNPVQAGDQTGSGFLVGRVKGTRQKPFMTPGEELMAGDVLRIGYEDEPWHRVIKIGRHIPKGGRFHLKAFAAKGSVKGIPIFLVDRRETALEEMISRLEDKLAKNPTPEIQSSTFNARTAKPWRKRTKVIDLKVYRTLGSDKLRGHTGVWFPVATQKGLPDRLRRDLWWWFPPVVWPDGEPEFQRHLNRILKNGARNFVLNAPWQAAFFPSPENLNLWAGPFCNTANTLAIQTLASLGFKGAIISPELGQADIVQLPKQSPLPLGIVVSGNWPLCVSRTLADQVKTGKLFTSPRGEQAWVRKYAADYWVYPNWKLDLSGKQRELERAGYSLFVHLVEPVPKGVKLKKRQGEWNWNINLK